MQGSLSQRIGRDRRSTAQADELNGLFVASVRCVGCVCRRNLYDGHRSLRKRSWTGEHAYTLADVRAVIGSKTFALYAGVFANSNKGDMSPVRLLVADAGLDSGE